ncbi:MAG: plastocyanin [Psychromonas sp.]|jgi:plastocyanin|uniref:cupredoxin domain-containing protein n=1 Tax=Psychromonas sp. TaxID=1884585 RepID=UPI0039E6B92D
MNKSILPAALLGLAICSPLMAETQTFELSIKNHNFEPSTLTIPLDERVKLVIKNEDATPEEFESHKLNREKIIPGNSEGVVFVGPLYAGEYPFVGEFHEESAHGKLIVK